MTTTIRLAGTGTALITPFHADGSIDESAFRALVRRQVENGIDILVPCGTTGESATLSREERELLVRTCVEEARGRRVKDSNRQRAIVVAGTGSNDTRVAVSTAKDAVAWGADAVLSLAPAYNKPPQDALVAHFLAVADGCGAPVVAYNVPGRVGVNIEAATQVQLAKAGIAGVKEASGNLAQQMIVLRDRPDGFAVLSGDDSFILALLALGADGCISVVGNEAPAQLSALVRNASRGDVLTARPTHERLLALMDLNFCESNPIPVKAAMSMMGLCENVLRAPLRPLAEGKRAAIEQALRSLELLA